MSFVKTENAMKTSWWWLVATLLGAVLLVACQPADQHGSAAQSPTDDDTTDDDQTDDDTSATPVQYDYDVPVKSTSPWPEFRRTSRNNGRSPILPHATDREPWFFQTAKGLFLAPVIDEDGTVYMGSADTNFYAIARDGTEKWRFPTGEIIDSTALIAADSTIYLPAGDGNLYAINPDGSEKWRLPALGMEGFITWWEAQVAMGPDGVLYAGNDDRHLYAINQDGTVRWTYATFDQVWSCPAFGVDGEPFFGANDFMVRSVTDAGQKRWLDLTLGPVASSPALNDDRTMAVVGSFDGYVHAYNTATGEPLWRFAARDHIYASPAIGADGTIYVGSADGTLYALNPDGTQQWAFDTLDPIRSSPAVDGDGNIYFGGADGRLYAMHPDGTRWWSYDTTESDRNDLNGSPAIDPDGVIIGGEAGTIMFLPFDYCETSGDERCALSPAEDIPPAGKFLYYYTSGGSSVTTIPDGLSPTEVLTFRLVVRENGDTIRARISPEGLDIKVNPNFARRVEVSADGNFLSIIPEQPLAMNTKYTVQIGGQYLVGGWRLGNRLIGGEPGDGFSGSFGFTTGEATGNELPLSVGDDQVSVLLMKRMAVPQPPMLTTFNQIGFDSYNYLLGTVAIDPTAGQFVLLAVEGTPGLTPTINFDTKSIFPLNGRYVDSYFSIAGTGFVLDVTGVSITLDLFRVAGLLAPDLTADRLNIYAEVSCANVEFFGVALELLGLCNPESGKMIVNGTAMLAPQTGTLGMRPAGLAVEDVTVSPTGGLYGGGTITATFSPNELDVDRQLPVILLVDPATGEALELGYGTSLEKSADGLGHLASVTLSLPAGFDPTGLRAVVLDNLFPLYQTIL